MLNSQPIISIVVPIFNEEEIIPILHRAISDAMAAELESWEVIYVDDGSRDASLSLLLAEQARDPHVRIVELSRNWGHQAALTAGLQSAGGEALVLIDGDLQDPPAVIPEMIAAWRSGAQVVVAARRSRRERGFRRLAFNAFYKVLGWLSDYPIPLNAGIFGLLDRSAADALNRIAEGHRYLPGLRAWVGYRTQTVYYDRAERAAGVPKASFRRLLRYALDAVFSFSFKPLRAILALGVLCLTAAAILAMVLAAVALSSSDSSTAWTWYAALLLFVAGLQLASVGVLGEYIGRIYDEVRRRPLFLINRVHQPSAASQKAAPERSQAA